MADGRVNGAVFKPRATSRGDIRIVGFLGGSVIKNPPANAGDTGSIPGPGRSHVPQDSRDQDPHLGRCPTREALR